MGTSPFDFWYFLFTKKSIELITIKMRVSSAFFFIPNPITNWDLFIEQLNKNNFSIELNCRWWLI